MVTYEFYRDVYLGCYLEEEDFHRMIIRAEAWMSQLEKHCRVYYYCEDGRSLAVCMVAECMYRYLCMLEINNFSVGKVSVCYQKNKDLRNSMIQSIAMFCTVLRGVC